MLPESSVPGSDDWVVQRLATKWGRGLPRLGKLRSYRDGTVMVPVFASGPVREAYLAFVNRCRLNLAELIASSRTNRLRPLGFRTAVAGDKNGDALAMVPWDRSNMTVGFRDLASAVADYGEAFVTVAGPDVPTVDGEVFFLGSDGWSTVTEQYRARPWITESAATFGHDPVMGVDIITLYRRGYMRLLTRRAKVSSFPTDGTPWSPGSGWSWAGDPILLAYTQDTPIVRVAARDGKGAFEPHLDTLDRINGTILDRTTIIAMQAFRQRAIEGDLPEFYPDDYEDEALRGTRIDYNSIFKAGPAALWRIPAGAKVWESATTDITPVLTAEDRDIRHLAAVSATPLYVLAPDASAGSAEGASLARETNIFAVEELADRFAGAFALVHALAFRAIGDDVRSDAARIKTIWAGFERASWTERSSAASQAKDTMPKRMIREKIYQLTPDEIEQAQQDDSDEAFLEPAVA
ncbi:hypothetical protein [Rathayibacter sp. Leaf248]|uniref:hypothetical protein n=1 Tax=Rathayibacter sp. Leaf248 TaxID=2876555 RepID=UPI001E4F6A96|nr:hypothetical protein [Rathayibacter sp. Leaf248]